MIHKLNIHDENEARRVLDLQHRSYRVEARLVGSDNLPPLKDTIATLQRCGETFYGFFAGEELTAVISHKRYGELLDIHRLFVSPDHFRAGRASALLLFVENAETGIERTIVSTGSLNTPARKLYVAHGFEWVGESEVALGLFVTRYEKMAARDN